MFLSRVGLSHSRIHSDFKDKQMMVHDSIAKEALGMGNINSTTIQGIASGKPGGSQLLCIEV